MLLEPTRTFSFQGRRNIVPNPRNDKFVRSDSNLSLSLPEKCLLQKHLHLVESFPSNIHSATETVTSTVDSSHPRRKEQKRSITVDPHALVDKSTMTRVTSKKKKKKKTRMVEPAPYPTKIQSTTILKERTTQTPHRSTTTYIPT